jgi:diguanylate cyclase (GGDEF)-like protein/PAS domain S-box-containing protein
MPRVTPREADADFEARLRAEVDRRAVAVPAMVHSINGNGCLVSVSDAWLGKLGYAREEVLGRPSSDFLTVESRDHAVRVVLPEFFRTGRCDNVQYQMVCKDGSVLDVLLSAILDKGPLGSVSVAVITDVTELVRARHQLVASEARYRGLVEDQSELVSLAGPGGQLQYVNRAYAAFYGKQSDEMIGRNLFEFVPQEHRLSLAEHLRHVCATKGSIEDENQVTLPGGEKRWLAWTNRALTDSDGCVTAIHSVGRDIQDRVLAEQRLHESEARYRMLAENSSDMVFQLDRDLVRRYVSPACRELLGYEPEEMLGVKPLSMAHPDDAGRLELVFQTLKTGRATHQSIVNRIRHRDGSWVWVEARFRAIRDSETGAMTGIIGAVRDISARKAVEDELALANRRLQILASQDGLTGLANRRAFDETLAKERLRARREQTILALIMIDVDWFKTFNDLYGHPAGDDCLRRVGGAIAGAILRPADLAARYGGEEFVVLLPNTDEDGAVMIGERIGNAIMELGIPHDANINGIVTVSAGVAAMAGGEGTAETLVENADHALYRAKKFGRNVVMAATGALPYATGNPSAVA